MSGSSTTLPATGLTEVVGEVKQTRQGYKETMKNEGERVIQRCRKRTVQGKNVKMQRSRRVI